MKRMLSTLFATVLTALPMTAGAEGGTFVRWDGTRFDSDVGAVCGALRTDILFAPGERTVDIYDEATLDFLASCLSHGELAGATIAVIGYGDSAYPPAVNADLARARTASVIDYLMARGVNPRSLTSWANTASRPGTGSSQRVQFRLVGPAPVTPAPAVQLIEYRVIPSPPPRCTF